MMCDRCEEICGCACGAAVELGNGLWGCYDCMHDFIPFSEEIKKAGF